MKRREKWVITFGSAVIISLTSLHLLGARINHTDSLPKGLYWTSTKTPGTGDLVQICPPDIDAFRVARDRHYIGYGFCQNSFEPLFKKLVGVAGDTVSIKDEGVFVNGQFISNSKPIHKDGMGRSLEPHYLSNYKLTENEVLLMSDFSPQSFDARYFGPIEKNYISSVIVPTPLLATKF